MKAWNTTENCVSDTGYSRMLLVLLLLWTLSISAVSAAIEDVDAMLKDAASIQKSGDTGRALHILRYATGHFPNSASAHFYLGLALFEAATADECVGELKKAIELDPKLSDAHFALGKMYLAKDK